ncbi:hypothetical protein BDW22DRAFT_840741 [Trametopsis cervina]|nr:hypothetical protein BDW22DRAFT_840741 [Trametopsis cervina]
MALKLATRWAFSRTNTQVSERHTVNTRRYAHMVRPAKDSGTDKKASPTHCLTEPCLCESEHRPTRFSPVQSRARRWHPSCKLRYAEFSQRHSDDLIQIDMIFWQVRQSFERRLCHHASISSTQYICQIIVASSNIGGRASSKTDSSSKLRNLNDHVGQ